MHTINSGECDQLLKDICRPWLHVPHTPYCQWNLFVGIWEQSCRVKHRKPKYCIGPGKCPPVFTAQAQKISSGQLDGDAW